MTAYYMLMASLPRHGKQYKSNPELISKLKLEKRLLFLNETDRIFLNEIIFLLWDSWCDPTLPFSETMKRAKPLLESKEPFIRDLTIWFFNLRSIFTAMRIRKRDVKFPAKPDSYWHSSFDDKIIKNWNKKDFGLKSVYLWLNDAVLKFENHESVALEDLFLSLLWQHLDFIEGRHYFDFEAVILYTLRWRIIRHWLNFNDRKSLDRLNNIAEKIIKDGFSKELTARTA